MLTPLPEDQRAQGGRFIFRYMPPIPYTKLPLSFVNQLSQLKNRGLLIQNEQKVIHLLEKVSYYRLSGYWYPLLEGTIAIDKERHVFKKGAQLNTAFRLYCFDRELRQLVQSELEKIEVAIRASMIYNLSHNSGAMWFSNPALFKSATAHTKSLASITAEYNRSTEQFINSFKTKYSDPLPPSWITLEITSFGTISMLYQNLKSGRRDIANSFGLDDKTFASWLHAIVYLRNICAHHSRLWNKILSIAPRIPTSPRKPWLNSSPATDRVFIYLSMISYLLNQINPHHRFKIKLKKLLRKYPNVDITAMGFPKNWESEILWKTRKVDFLPHWILKPFRK